MFRKRKNYFEGWYIKLQCGDGTLALIPSCHRNEDGEQMVSLQILTESESYQLDFTEQQCHFGNRTIRLGDNVFSVNGLNLHIVTKRVTLTGKIKFGPWAVPQFDIMGPFAKVKCMPCYHTVHSMYHEAWGKLTLNGKPLHFKPGSCYIEGDHGCSFPENYIWTHHTWQKNSLMLSVAEISIGPKQFFGCIGLLYLDGEIRRIATYLGAKVMYADSHTIMIKQGRILLLAECSHQKGSALSAPVNGMMGRTIKESLNASVHYRIYESQKKLLDVIAGRAAFENSWDK